MVYGVAVPPVDASISRFSCDTPGSQCLLTYPAPLTSCCTMGSPTSSTEPTPLTSASSFSFAFTIAAPKSIILDHETNLIISFFECFS